MNNKMNKETISIVIKPALIQKMRETKKEVGIPISIQIEKALEAKA